MAQEILGVFHLLEKELKGGGKEKSTEPYKHFEDTMNEVYDYVKDVFETNEQHKKNHANSIYNMDKDCDCPDKYKAEQKDANMTTTSGSYSSNISSISGTIPIFKLYDDVDNREQQQEGIVIKQMNEWL
jgi:hypothetical protein